MDEIEIVDEEIARLLRQMDGMPRKYKQDVLEVARKLLDKESEISLELIEKCRIELNAKAYRESEESSKLFTDQYAESSPEASPSHVAKPATALPSVASEKVGNAFQERAQLMQPSYARPVSANRPTTTISGRSKTMRMSAGMQHIMDGNAAVVKEKEQPSDARLNNLKTVDNTQKLDDQKTQLIKDMTKQDAKLETERERQRTEQRQRMQQKRELKQEQQAGRAFEILDHAIANQATQAQVKEKQEEEVKKRLEQLKKQRETVVTDIGDEIAVAVPPEAAEKKTKKKQRGGGEGEDARVEIIGEDANASTGPAGEDKSKKKKKAKSKADADGDADAETPAGNLTGAEPEKPRKKKKTRTQTADSTVVEIENS